MSGNQLVQVVNTGTGPVDLADGRILAPGDAPVEVRLTRHERDMIESGVLTQVAGKGASK